MFSKFPPSFPLSSIYAFPPFTLLMCCIIPPRTQIVSLSMYGSCTTNSSAVSNPVVKLSPSKFQPSPIDLPRDQGENHEIENIEIITLAK